MKVIETMAYILTVYHQRVIDSVKNVLITYAEGDYLDHLGALLGEFREPEEIDERFKTRILTAFHKASSAGAAPAYEALAFEADSRVKGVKAYDLAAEAAKAYITILSNETETGEASEELIQIVSDYLNHEDRKPLGAQVIVSGVEVLNYSIDAQISYREDADKVTVEENILAAVNKLIQSKHRIGAEIALSEVYASLNIEGVAVVTQLNQPTGNILTGKHQAPFCNSINITEVN